MLIIAIRVNSAAFLNCIFSPSNFSSLCVFGGIGNFIKYISNVLPTYYILNIKNQGLTLPVGGSRKFICSEICLPHGDYFANMICKNSKQVKICLAVITFSVRLSWSYCLIIKIYSYHLTGLVYRLCYKIFSSSEQGAQRALKQITRKYLVIM